MGTLFKLIFLVVFFFQSGQALAKSNPSISLLSQKQIKKLGKLEREYYLKKLGQIVANFEQKLTKNKRFSAQNQFPFNINFMNTAYAGLVATCPVGGQSVNYINNKCSLKEHKCNNFNTNKYTHGFLCGDIYKGSEAERCVGYKKGDYDISMRCGQLGINDSKTSELKAYQEKYCGSGSQFINKDGCKYLEVATASLREAVNKLSSNKVLALDCGGNYLMCKLCQTDETGKVECTKPIPEVKAKIFQKVLKLGILNPNSIDGLALGNINNMLTYNQACDWIYSDYIKNSSQVNEHYNKFCVKNNSNSDKKATQ